MFWLLVFYLTFVKCGFTDKQSIEQKIDSYFKSKSTEDFRKSWDLFSNPLEHALEIALKDSIGVPGMNVYVRKNKDALSSGYYHDDNQVKLIMNNLKLEELPRFWQPEVRFSLASNVLKLQSVLSNMIIRAEYTLARNKSDIIYDGSAQNPYKSSPFLFQPVFNNGKIAINVNGCILLGLVITTLTAETINVGYQQLKLINCAYTLEIYRGGTGAPPVIAKYLPYRNDDGLSLSQLLMKKISYEIAPKLQAALLTNVNTTSAFGENLTSFRRHQEDIFSATTGFLTELVRNVNRATIQMNNGMIQLDDFSLHWTEHVEQIPKMDGATGDEEISLTNMFLTGVDSLYSSHSGGAYKLDSLKIADEMRLTTLQIRGNVTLGAMSPTEHTFAVELSEMSLDVQFNIKNNVINPQAEKKITRLETQLKSITVTGYRSQAFKMSDIVIGSTEAFIIGYLQREVPKVLVKHFREAFRQALEPYKKRSNDKERSPRCYCEDDDGNPEPDNQNLSSDATDLKIEHIEKINNNIPKSEEECNVSKERRKRKCSSERKKKTKKDRSKSRITLPLKKNTKKPKKKQVSKVGNEKKKTRKRFGPG